MLYRTSCHDCDKICQGRTTDALNETYFTHLARLNRDRDAFAAEPVESVYTLLQQIKVEMEGWRKT